MEGATMEASEEAALQAEAMVAEAAAEVLMVGGTRGGLRELAQSVVEAS